MNKDILKGKWTEMKGDIKQKWGKLTDDDLQQIDGSYDKLVGRVQQAYGYRRDEAEKEVNSYMSNR